LTLIAKSLQGLANMSTFGAKEHWMEPMNAFLNNNRQEFKSFLDTICAVPSNTGTAMPMPPSYSTPLAIFQRLPPTSQEGFPSLPYLIDHPRHYAALVSLWLEHSGSAASNIAPSDGDLLKFHQLCQTLHKRTQDCLSRAERAERPSSALSMKWEELAEQLEKSMTHETRERQARQHQQQQQGAQKTNSNANNENTQEDFTDDATSSTASTPVTMGPIRSKTRSYSSNQQPQPLGLVTATTNSSHYAPSSGAASATASASVSAAEETPPGSSHGWEDGVNLGGGSSQHPNRLHKKPRRKQSSSNVGPSVPRDLPGSSRSSIRGPTLSEEESEEEYTALPNWPPNSAEVSNGKKDKDKEKDKEKNKGLTFKEIMPGFKKKKNA
jgi:hypothetical protein